MVFVEEEVESVRSDKSLPLVRDPERTSDEVVDEFSHCSGDLAESNDQIHINPSRFQAV